MCGIVGVVSNDPEARSADVVRRMLGRLRHRGPDDEGLATAGIGSIGARRLAIIDLVAGAQPMANETGSVFAVQNGELYNFQALRGELESLGHRFVTRNDTEVLPHAYEEWGPDLFRRLRGMFAIAIWDEPRRSLVLARDRFGKKPLFYAQTRDAFIFGSEIQALLAHPGVPRDIDVQAIDDYLTFGYIPHPRTAFSAIRKLRPAHHIILSDGRLVDERRYWALSFQPKLTVSLDEAATRVRELIADAVQVRLMSDVPLGAFLSGGLDSSTVVAFMATHSAAPVKTFSIGFTDRRYDELAYARTVARAFGTDHQELVVDADDAVDLPMLARHLGEPFADSSIVPSFQVAQITRRTVTVALNGDGGDELFAGYDRYKAAALARLTIERLPRLVVAGAALLAGIAPEHRFLPRPYLRARRFVAAFGLDPEQRYVRWTGYFTGDLHKRIAGERLRDLASEPAALLASAGDLTGATEAAERFMASDIEMGLPGDLLVKMDIASMASSLETRSPLLDHHLAEYVARLPLAYKLSARTSKILLRRAMRGVLPESILTRGKMGFTAPVGAWLRGPLRPMFEDLVLGGPPRGFIDTGTARALFDEHVRGTADRTPMLWALLMLEVWFHECVDVPSSTPVLPEPQHTRT